ncbi:MAG: DedA family protein [Nitratireductor sp.]|nr:DedA family protein [Nitratireductor sp.]
MIRWLYDWVFSLARHKRASWALAGISFVESSVFPIPPDVLLIPMVLAERRKWLFYAALCTVASVFGAFLGYFIGYALYETIGKPILEFYQMGDRFDDIANWYNKWGGWGVLFAAVTPFPYKVLTIFSGATGLNFLIFTVVSIVGRGMRFVIVSGLLYLYGEPVRIFIEKRLGLMFFLALALLLGGFLAIKYVF